MQIFKYLLLATLVVCITKKAHPSFFGTSKANKPQLEEYDPSSKTATIAKEEDTFVGVIEYNQETTPPNISNPSMKAFATMPTPGHAPQKGKGLSMQNFLIGGTGAITTLYGLPVSGNRLVVKDNNLKIGFYWPDSRIVQLNNGDTFVEVLEEKVGNYRNFHKVGPVWTRFSEQALLSKYGISTKASDFQGRIETNIGTIIISNHARSRLLGVRLQDMILPPKHAHKKSFKLPISHIPKQSIDESEAEKNNTSQASAVGMYNDQVVNHKKK